MPLDPHRLLVLRAVRRAGGVLPAARALHLTPSGVSQHLSKLEAEAGVPLVDRTRRGGGRTLTLTPAGRALADQAEHLAAAMSSAERELDRFKEHRGGTVRVGGFAAALDRLVAPAVLSLSLTDPGIDPRIFELAEKDGLDLLATGELDLLLSERPGPIDLARPSGVRESDLMHDPFRIVVPQAWPVEDPAGLLARPWIVGSQHPTRRALEGVAVAHGITLDVRHIGYNSTTMLALVSAGLGAAIIPALTLAPQLPGSVRVHTGPPDVGSRTLTLLHAAETDPPSVERFAQELRTQAFAIEQAPHVE